MERRESAIDEDLDEELSEEEEEDEEPKLKYQRLGQSISEILKKDHASCMAVLDKFLLMGTHQGLIYMLDFNGDKIREFRNHSSRVNDISVDEAKEFIASCSDDGKVVIQGLYAEEKFEYEHSRPVTSVALDPMFSKTKKPRFVTGGKSGQLMMTTKGWFGPKNDLIHQGEGSIFAIKWRGPLIAWANEVGVKIFDCETGERITYIDRPRGSPRPDLYRCCLVWESANQLLIGWADCVKICRIKVRPQANSSGLPARYVEINGMFQTDFFICGIAPFGEDLVLLAYTEEQVPDPNNPGKTMTVSNLPELRIVTRTNTEISSDALSIVGHQTHTSMDYRLEQMPGESMYYIVAPRDIVLARPRDRDDHLAWLIERERYEEALEAAEGHEKDLRNHNITEIGERYLDFLLANGEFDKAAAVSSKILKRDVQLWEKWIFKFAKIRQLKEIAPYIPVGNPLLSPHVYEMVLQWQLREDAEGFFKTVTEWPSTLYHMDALLNAVEEKLKGGENNFLLHSLAKLYTYDKKFDKTLQIYLKLGSGNIFDLIKTYNLFDSISDKILLLVRFHPEKAVDLLTSNTNKLPVAEILKQLEPDPKLQLFYLHHLRKKETIVYDAKFHDLQVQLYADFDLPNLLDFLQKSNSYNLDKAYEVCVKRKLYREMVFILGRMGNVTAALDLLINQLRDVQQAIDFVEKQNDEELWDELINKSINDPTFVSGLLENAGTHINPLKLISKIKQGMEIPGLRDRLVKIIGDYNLQMSLREGCKDVLKADCVMLASKLHEGAKQGSHVEDMTRCQLCSANVFANKKRGGVVIFFCTHVFHQQCLAQSDSKRASAKLPLSPVANNNNANVALNQSGALELNKKGLSCPICRQTQS